MSSSFLIPWLTGSEWCWFISLPGSLINHVSSYDQQKVSDTLVYFFARQSHQRCCIHHYNQQFVSDTGLCLARQFNQLCLMIWPTVCEWYWFISMPGSLINPMTNREWVTLVYFFARQCLSSYDQQTVSDTGLFLCKAVSSIMSHDMTNRMWVTLVYFSAWESHQSCLILWLTDSEWHKWFISLPGSLINHLSSYDQ